MSAVAVSVLLAACSSSSSTSAGAASTSSESARSTPAASLTPVTGPVQVSISNYAYDPAKLTVAPGTKVRFANHDQTAHTATTHARGFDTGTLQPGHSATVTLTKPGTYTYYCQFHAFMHAVIVVK